MRSRAVPAACGPARCIAVLVGVACGVFANAAVAQPNNRAGGAVFDLFVGTWDVTTTTRLPKPSVVHSTFTWGWVLDHRFLRGESSVKSDGSQELQIFGQDARSGRYPLWIFYSSGNSLYLERGEWSESTRTMEWKNAPNDPIVYTTRCIFEGADTLRCVAQVKSPGAAPGRGGSGALAVDVESLAVRRR